MFRRPVRIPDRSGAFTEVRNGKAQYAGVGGILFTERLALWGDVIVVDDFHMPVNGGDISGYKYA